MSQPTCIVPRPAASNTTCSNCASSLPNQDKGTLGEALGAPELEQILTEETGCHRQRIYPPMVTLRLFIDQILSTDQACQEAVSQRLVDRVVQGHCGGHLRQCMNQVTNTLAGTLLKSISRCVLPKRPGRIEPRAKKRRPKPLPLLTVPRWVAREQIRAQRA